MAMAGRTEMIRMDVVILLHLGFGTRKKERNVACMNGDGDGDSVKGPRA